MPWEQVTNNISVDTDLLSDEELDMVQHYCDPEWYERTRAARKTQEWFLDGRRPDWWYNRQKRLREANEFISRFLGPRDGVPIEEWWDETDSGGACVICLAPVKEEYAARWQGCCGRHWFHMNFRLYD